MLLTTRSIRFGCRKMDHPYLGELLLTKDAFGWVAEAPGLDGKVVASADTLRELREKLEKMGRRG